MTPEQEWSEEFLKSDLANSTHEKSCTYEMCEIGYIAGRKKAQKELKDKDDLIIILKMKLNGSKEKVKERDGLIAEMKILRKENALLYRSYNKVCDEINRGEHLDFEWVRGIIQDEVTHPVIDASVKVVDSYRRKIDELKEELKREREAVDFYAYRKNWQTPESQGFIVDDSCVGITDMIEEFDSRDSNCGGNKARQTQQQRRIEL